MLRNILATLVAAMAFSTIAHAEIYIRYDVGGEVSSYVQKYKQIRASGERVVIDGPCLSACTLLTGGLPRQQVCVTANAELGFHSASYYDDSTKSFVPTREGTREVMSLYPASVRAWIKQRGGLTPNLKYMRGKQLEALYQRCN